MKRIRVGIAKLLTWGTDCTVVRKSVVNSMQQSANEMNDFIAKSGSLQSDGWIHAWRRLHYWVNNIRDGAARIEVGE